MRNRMHIHSEKMWKERNKRKKEKINEELVKFHDAFVHEQNNE